jgi:FkbM family methyltransferase
MMGRVLRLPLRMIPRQSVLSIRNGINRGQKWVFGSSKPGFWLGAYEEDKQDLVARIVRPGTVIWDVGANVGFYTLAFSRLTGPEGRVFAFEPLASNFATLLRHVGLNNLSNVVPVLTALDDSRRFAGFDQGPNDLMGRLTSTGGHFLIPTVTADSFLTEVPAARPALIKLDVEGAEGAVLDGSRRLLSEVGPDILLALHGADTERRCRAVLEETGYKCYYLDGSPAEDLPFKSDEIWARKVK